MEARRPTVVIGVEVAPMRTQWADGPGSLRGQRTRIGFRSVDLGNMDETLEQRESGKDKDKPPSRVSAVLPKGGFSS